MLYISDEYLYGFVDGEGCFYVGVVPSRETKLKYQVIVFFKVSQNPKGKVVLDYLKKRLACGYVKPNDHKDSSDKTLAFVVRDFLSLKTKVIPFFENKLIVKRKEFLKFKKVIKKIDKKEHLTKNGLKEILDIAYSMNSEKRKVRKEEILKHIK
ncbi:MAG: LAGLIDADG family homing endonuclease [Microgenomates group bacterium]